MATEALPNLQGKAPTTGAWDGAGIFSDINSTADSISKGDGLGFATNGVGVGLSALGAISDPLGSLLSAGVGWLIEHLSFLRQPLDMLCGDPHAVQGQANTWTNVGTEMSKVAEDYEKAVRADIRQWTGAAGEAYRKQGEELVKELKAFSQAAGGVSSGITIAGVLVGTERGIILDLISSFIGKLIERALLALASSVITVGGSVAAFITDAVVEGSILAGKCASRIAKVLAKLSTLLGRMSRLGHGVGALATKLSRFAGKAGMDAKHVAKDIGHFAGAEKSGQQIGKAGEQLIRDVGMTHEAADKLRGASLAEIAKEGLQDAFTIHHGDRLSGVPLPPSSVIEGGKQIHEGIDHNKDGHKEAKETVESGGKGGAKAG